MLNLEVIEPIINYRKVKYSIMDELISNSNITGKRVNMYINLDTIMSRFYNDEAVISAFKSLKGKELIQLTAEIFNLIAHYRNYFWTRYKVKTTFFIYTLNKNVKNSGDNYCKNMFDKKKESHISNGVVNYVFNKNYDLISQISKYIKNTYFIESNGLDPTVLPYYLINNIAKKDVANIVLSSDKMDYTLMNLPNTFILHAAGKHSKLLSVDNIFDHKMKNIKYRPSIEIDSSLYPLILALTGLKERGIPTVCSFSNACKRVIQGIEDGIIYNGYNADIKYFAKEYFKKDAVDKLISNYKSLDTIRHFRLMRDVDEILIDERIVDRYDNSALIHLNSNYFELNNIQLIELCKGV